MTLNEFKAAVAARAALIYSLHGEIDPALLFEFPEIIEGAAQLFPHWMDDDCTLAKREADQAALQEAIYYATEGIAQ